MTLMLDDEDNGPLSRPLRAAGSSRERARRLGAFLTQSLEYIGFGRETFAERLGLDVELVDTILAGLFPLSNLDDDLLAQMAYHLNLDVQVLRVFRDPNAAPPLPLLNEGADESETVTASQDVLALLRDIQAESQDDSPHSPASILVDFYEAKPVEPPPEVYEPLKLRRVDDTLRSFFDDLSFGETR